MANFIIGRYPALGSVRYRRYWLASFASVGATQLINLGQGWLVFELSGSALALGLLGAAAAIPNILMTLLGGVIADRLDKRRIMMCTSSIITALLATLAWLDYSGVVALWHVLTIAALVSLITGLDWPARVSFYPQLVERSAFMSAVALNSFIWQSTRMAIPAVGGLIIAIAGDTWIVFALGAAGFLVMFLVISAIRVTSSRVLTVMSPVEQLREGIGFIWHQPLFRNLIGLTFVGMFFSQAYVQIMPVFVDLLDSDERGYGYLLSAGGVGSVIGTLLVGGVQKYRQLGILMLAGAAVSALALIAFAAAANAGSFTLALALTFAASVFASVFMISSMTVMQLEVPDNLRGRVMGIHTIGFSLMPLGGLFIGTLAETSDASTALIIGSSIYLVGIVAVWILAPVVRELDGGNLSSTDAQPAAD